MFPHIDWFNQSEGPAPSTPFVANTVPDYFGGRPTPPPTPVYARRTTLIIEDFMPCPPSPFRFPSSPQEDEFEGYDSPISEPTSWLTSELDHSTVFADPMNETYNNPSDQTGYDRPHVSDCLIYSPQMYASPSPVLMMIQRATLDKSGLLNQSVNPLTCDKPFKLFSLTCGHTPRTGSDDRDRQSFLYYASSPFPCLFRQPECFLSYNYPIGIIENVQRSLCTNWSLVYPSPIPVIIIRSQDIIGPFSLTRRLNGFAHIVRTGDSIWPTICQRGVDSTFRPLDPSATVDNTLCHMGESVYWPQHIVASKFAVNVFLETSGNLVNHCDYLGAYIVQVMEHPTIHSAVWADIDPEFLRSVYDRVPYHFEGQPNYQYVRFLYYKWDEQIVGLADETKFIDAPRAPSDSADSLDETDSGFDTPSAYSPEPEHTSFLDLSPGA